jgi:hypothetical protein
VREGEGAQTLIGPFNIFPVLQRFREMGPATSQMGPKLHAMGPAKSPMGPICPMGPNLPKGGVISHMEPICLRGTLFLPEGVFGIVPVRSEG